MYSHIDVNGDAVLSSAFKTIADWPTVPMLFVRGRLFGGSDVVSEYVREEGGLRRALEEELAARGVIGEELEAVFSANEVIGVGCDGGKDGQHAEGYSPAHRQMLLRLVTAVPTRLPPFNAPFLFSCFLPPRNTRFPALHSPLLPLTHSRLNLHPTPAIRFLGPGLKIFFNMGRIPGDESRRRSKGVEQRS